MPSRKKRERKIAADVEEGLAGEFGADEPSIRSQITKFFTGRDDPEEQRRKKAARVRAARVKRRRR